MPPAAARAPDYPGSGYFTLAERQARELRDRPQGRPRPLPLPHALRARRALSQAACSATPARERRQSIPTEIHGRVTCRRGGKRVIHTYQQNTLTRARAPPRRLLAALVRIRRARRRRARERGARRSRAASARRRATRSTAATTRGCASRSSPSPSDAPITPSAPCTLIPARTGPAVCAFGLPATRARASFALVGDSHAVHWRAALEVVARAKGWRGVSMDQSQCLFSRATTALRERGARGLHALERPGAALARGASRRRHAVHVPASGRRRRRRRRARRRSRRRSRATSPRGTRCRRRSSACS